MSPYRVKCFLAFATFIWLIHPQAHSAGTYDPCLKWRSLKTEHFRIHYHQGLEHAARRMAVIAEKAHLELSAKIGWTTALRTDLVLTDNTDLANGSATPYPFNRIEIYISRPEPDSTLGNYDDWLESVFTHEYTHILNLDTVHGLPQAGRRVLGRNPLFYPNLFQPVWIIEGNAVFHESRKKPFGRNNSAYTDMIMRTDALAGSFKSIGKASHFTREWPRGKVPYLYGGLFIQYLEDAYGQGSFARYMHENADNLVPFSDNIYPIPGLFNKDAMDVYGKPFFMLWNDWREKTVSRYREQASAIESRGLTAIDHISDAGSSSRFPRFSRDGKTVYYVSSSDRKGGHLYAHDLAKKSAARLCRVNAPSSLSAADSGDLYLADDEYYRNFSLYTEGFIYGRHYRQATSRLRARHIEAFKHGLIYITFDRDRYSLVISDPDFRNPREIISRSPVQISGVRVSPDGVRAAFTLKDGGGHADIAIIDLKTQAMIRITDDPGADTSPAWLPDGKKLLFASDRSGIYNLHEYDLATHRISRITSVTGGLFSPDISPDGTKIAVASYQPNGFRIGLIDYPKTTFDVETAEPEVLDMSFFEAAEQGDNGGEVDGSRPYCAWNSVLPAFYIPVLETREFYPGAYDFITGVWVQGNDTLNRHSYYLALNLYLIQVRLGIQASYTYSGLYPDITVGYYDDAIFLWKDNFPWESRHDYFLERKLHRGGYLTNVYPFITYRVQQYLQCGYYLEKEFRDRYRPGRDTISDERLLGRMQFGYTINNAYVYPYSISREHGRDLAVTADVYHRYFGSDEDFYKIRADYSEYLPGFYRSSVILLRLRGGICLENGDERPYSLGRFESGYVGTPAAGDDELGIRGFPAGEIRGNRLLAATAEIRLPLVQKDAAFRTVPVMFRDLWMNVFFDCGSAFDGPLRAEDIGYSAGAELNLKITLGYNVDVTGRIGYAYGFTAPGGHQVYFAVSSFLEGSLYPQGSRPRRQGKNPAQDFEKKRWNKESV